VKLSNATWLSASLSYNTNENLVMTAMNGLRAQQMTGKIGKIKMMKEKRFSNIIPSQGIVTKAWRQRDTKLATQ